MSEGLLTLHNQYRSEYKPWSIWRKPKPLNLLVLNYKLMKYAYKHCEWMADNRTLKHSSIRDIMALGFDRAAENIAWGQKTTEDVMKTWMNSMGHRRNILGDYKYMGYAFSPDPNGRLYWCVVFGG
jgi:uncharacterized protein YkwD